MAELVLDAIAQLQTLFGESSIDPELSVVALREISLSIPFESDSDEPLPVLDEERVLTLTETRSYLLQNDRQVRLEHPRLDEQPQSRLSRLNLRIQL